MEGTASAGAREGIPSREKPWIIPESKMAFWVLGFLGGAMCEVLLLLLYSCGLSTVSSLTTSNPTSSAVGCSSIDSNIPITPMYTKLPPTTKSTPLTPNQATTLLTKVEENQNGKALTPSLEMKYPITPSKNELIP